MPPEPLLRHHTTWIWLVLVVATAISWWLGTTKTFGLSSHEAIGVTVLAVGFIKARFVGLDFMEAREAPLPLRLAMDIWIFGTFVWLSFLFVRG